MQKIEGTPRKVLFVPEVLKEATNPDVQNQHLPQTPQQQPQTQIPLPEPQLATYQNE